MPENCDIDMRTVMGGVLRSACAFLTCYGYEVVESVSWKFPRHRGR